MIEVLRLLSKFWITIEHVPQPTAIRSSQRHDPFYELDT
jgi:hypothetical protein